MRDKVPRLKTEATGPMEAPCKIWAGLHPADGRRVVGWKEKACREGTTGGRKSSKRAPQWCKRDTGLNSHSRGRTRDKTLPADRDGVQGEES